MTDVHSLVRTLKTAQKPTNSNAKVYRVEHEGKHAIVQGRKGYTEEQILKELAEHFKLN